MCKIQIKVLNWSLIYSNQCIVAPGSTPGVLIDNETVEPHYIPLESELLGVGQKNKNCYQALWVILMTITFFCLIRTQLMHEY